MTRRLGFFGLPLLAAAAAGAVAPQPVYLLLYTNIDDHVHLSITEARLHHTLDLLNRLTESAHDQHISVVLQFSGAMAQAIENGELKSIPAGLIRTATERRMVEIGYRAADEPTHTSRGVPPFRGTKTIADWWTARSAAVSSLLMDAKDPLSGKRLTGSGGLKKTVEVFGPVSCIGDWRREVGGDTEFVHQIRRLKLSPLAFGLPEPAPARQVHGYRDAVRTLGGLMSPDADSAPELFWQDGLLRLSETSDRAVRVVHAYEGADAFQKVNHELDRSKPHVLRVEIASQEIYLQPEFAKGSFFPPVRFAYDHPDRPALPPEALRTREEIEKAYMREEALLQWLVGDFQVANPGSRFVSAADLITMTAGAAVLRLSWAELSDAARDLLNPWASDSVPPNYARSGNQYLSLADMFQLLATALGDLHRTDRLPATVTLRRVYGPEEMTAERGPNDGEVSVASVAGASALLADRLNEERWTPTPLNVIPASISMAGLRVNAAQFLRLMAEALIAPSAADKLRVRMSSMFSPAGEMFPISCPRADQGATWTLKPAILRVAKTRVQTAK